MNYGNHSRHFFTLAVFEPNYAEKTLGVLLLGPTSHLAIELRSQIWASAEAAAENDSLVEKGGRLFNRAFENIQQ